MKLPTRLASTATLTLALTLATVVVAAAAGSFLETFDGAPATPLNYQNPHSWDIFPTGLDTQEVGAAVQVGQHGPNCERPGFPYTTTNTHPLLTTADQVYICNNHLMTAVGLTGYSAVYMVPPAMADFSAGPATISWDMSTLRTASRDWVYFTLMPFDGHNKFSYNNNDQAIAPNNINIKLAGTNAFFACQRVNGNTPGQGGDCGVDVRVNGDSTTQWQDIQAANGVAPDAARRDSFRVELTATHLRVCITGNNAGQTYTYHGTTGFCWVDSDLPTPLDPAVWHGQAVFMITHVSYNPEKSCSAVDDATGIVHNPIGDANCPPNTWHWDNVAIAPAVPFTIINPTQQYPSFTDPGAVNTVTFARPAPANAFLSYIAGGDCTKERFSVDGGVTWIAAHAQPATTQCQHPENGGEYWTPIPAGTTSVTFSGERMYSVWYAAGIAIWALGAPQPILSTPVPSATPVPTAAPTATATPTAAPTTPPTPAPTNPPSAAPTNPPSPAPTATAPPLQTPSPSQSPTPGSASCMPSVGPGIPPPANVPAGIPGQHAAWFGQSGYPTLCAGQSSTATVAFYNSGTIGWVKSRMGQVAYLGTWGPEPGQDQPTALGGDGQLGTPNTGWPRYNRIAIQPADYVGPGQVAWFQFTIQAPTAPGTYRLYLRPLIEGATWLEDYGVYWVVTVR
jgi:hypothetical protein